MLSGCDYLPSLPGVGIKTAHKLLRRFRTVEKVSISPVLDIAAQSLDKANRGAL